MTRGRPDVISIRYIPHCVVCGWDYGYRVATETDAHLVLEEHTRKYHPRVSLLVEQVHRLEIENQELKGDLANFVYCQEHYDPSMPCGEGCFHRIDE